MNNKEHAMTGSKLSGKTVKQQLEEKIINEIFDLFRSHAISIGHKGSNINPIGESKPKYLTEHQVSELTGIAVQTLRNQRYQRKGIPYSKIGNKSVRYLESDVIAYMESRRIAFEG